jgi:hypothetical protein
MEPAVTKFVTEMTAVRQAMNAADEPVKVASDITPPAPATSGEEE